MYIDFIYSKNCFFKMIYILYRFGFFENVDWFIDKNFEINL